MSFISNSFICVKSDLESILYDFPNQTDPLSLSIYDWSSKILATSDECVVQKHMYQLRTKILVDSLYLRPLQNPILSETAIVNQGFDVCSIKMPLIWEKRVFDEYLETLEVREEEKLGISFKTHHFAIRIITWMNSICPPSTALINKPNDTPFSHDLILEAYAFALEAEKERAQGNETALVVKKFTLERTKAAKENALIATLPDVDGELIKACFKEKEEGGRSKILALEKNLTEEERLYEEARHQLEIATIQQKKLEKADV